MTEIRVGSIVRYKGGNDRPMRVLRIMDDDVIVEYMYKMNYLGEKVYSPKGKGVLEKVKFWQIEKRPKTGLSGESTRLWVLSSTPIYG